MIRISGKVVSGAFVLVVLLSSLPSSFIQSSYLLAPAWGKAEQANRVADWFKRYDEIRREAQMSDSERERSRSLMTQGIAASFMQSRQADQDKAAASALLSRMVDRYRRAISQINALPCIPETKKLQAGYALYFSRAGQLFADYLKVQHNLLATDSNGNPILGQMQQRKGDLEALDVANKELDGRLRQKYKIAPYTF